MHRIGLVGSPSDLGLALSSQLHSNFTIHGIRSWSEHNPESVRDWVANPESFEDLVNGLNGCRYAIWCRDLPSPSTPKPAYHLSLQIRAFLAACRETQISRTIVVLPASTMVADGVLDPSRIYTPGTGSDWADAVFSAEQDVLRFRADAMDVVVLNRLPLGVAGQGGDPVCSAADVAKQIAGIIEVRDVPQRMLADHVLGTGIQTPVDPIWASITTFPGSN